jgi:hypothetical protein
MPSLPLSLAGGLSQAGSLGREAASRVAGAPELVASLAGSTRPKKLRFRIVILRDETGGPVVEEEDVGEALEEANRVLRDEAAVALVPLDGRFVEVADAPAPRAALDSPCTDSGLWRTDLGAAGRYFRAHRRRGRVGQGSPITVFVVRDVVGKCGCSLGPLGDYVTIDPDGLRTRTRRILAHELGHSCGLRHVSDEANLMRARSPGEHLTRWQRAVLRSSRHVTYA